jgi:hypothetical protein
MRKSERLRILELELVRMQFHLEILTSAITQLMESNQMTIPDLDSGKWYDKKGK